MQSAAEAISEYGHESPGILCRCDVARPSTSAPGSEDSSEPLR